MTKMLKKSTLLLLVIALFGLLISGLPSWGQEKPGEEGGAMPPQGPRMGLFMLLGSIQQGDLVILQSGGQLGGTVEQEDFTVEGRTLSRDEILLIYWGAAGEAAEGTPAAQVFLKDGTSLTGALESSTIEVSLPIGESAVLSQEDLRGIIFQLELPQEGWGRDKEKLLKQTVYPLFRGLKGTTLLQAILEGQQKFDLLFFPYGCVLSVNIENEEFTLESSIFGVHTLAVADIANVRFGDPDWLVLATTGDQVSGTVTPDGDGMVRATAATGSSLSLTKDELGGIAFKLPAGALGGGGKPHFQPGPGK